METEHCVFIEEGPCETVSTDITVEEIASTVNGTEFHATDPSVVKFQVILLFSVTLSSHFLSYTK